MEMRSVAEWMEILKRVPAPNDQLVEEVISNRILSDVKGYRQNSIHRIDDAKNLGNALEAYHQILKEWDL